MNPALRPLIQSCVTVTFVLYAFLSLFREAFFSPLPFGFILTLGLICAIHLLRVPAPEKSSVEAIFGAELSEPEGIKVTTIAHRGALLDAPENSLAAFEMCKNEGPIAVEFDICLTSDGVPIVFHDSTLERMTGLPQVVSETKWEELSKIDISVKHLYKDRYPNTNIPTLEQTITQLLASGQKMIIDIKDNNTKMVKVIHDLFKNHNELYSRAVVSTFFPNLIYLIRRGDPKIVCSMAWRPHAFAYTSYSYPEGKGPKKYEQWYKHFAALVYDEIVAWALPNFLYHLLGLSFVLLHKDAVTAQTIIEWRKKGVRVMAWPVNSPVEKQHFARNLKVTYLTDTLTGESSTHLLP